VLPSLFNRPQSPLPGQLLESICGNAPIEIVSDDNPVSRSLSQKRTTQIRACVPNIPPRGYGDNPKNAKRLDYFTLE
jgi:hypothetical protein